MEAVDFRYRILAFLGRALSLTGVNAYFLVASSWGNGASASMVSSVPLFPKESRTLHYNQLVMKNSHCNQLLEKSLLK